MTQLSLCQLVGLSPSGLSRIENGHSDAGWGTLRRIARALDIPFEALLEEAEDHAPGPGGMQWRRETRVFRRRLGATANDRA